jgi:hypothetical protein
MITFKGSQFEQAISLWGVRWYVAYPISYWQLVELLIDRVIVTDGEVEIRYVIPTSSRAEQTCFCHLRLDYRAGSSGSEAARAPHVRIQVVLGSLLYDRQD